MRPMPLEQDERSYKDEAYALGGCLHSPLDSLCMNVLLSNLYMVYVEVLDVNSSSKKFKFKKKDKMYNVIVV